MIELVHAAIALQLWSSTAMCCFPRERNVWVFILLYRSKHKILFNKEVIEQ